MTAPVSYTATGRIGTIVIDSPPVNALSHGVRQGIIECPQGFPGADDTEVVFFAPRRQNPSSPGPISPSWAKPPRPQRPRCASPKSHPKPFGRCDSGDPQGGGLGVGALL
ncbi:MAG: hypothetical protein CM15mP125_0360 [Gammaproteobacteria bacterium]|nr:MAG: hypothetical protein CM15mP125_0360 [Gammaproteobacteria bacterium]